MRREDTAVRPSRSLIQRPLPNPTRYPRVTPFRIEEVMVFEDGDQGGGQLVRLTMTFAKV